MIYDILIIGAGQAGLTLAYYLIDKNLKYIILDKEKKVGDVWRKRYDSLTLFTSKEYSHLPGLKMTTAKEYFPTKDEFADYLENYSKQFKFRIHLNTKVVSLNKVNKIFTIKTKKQIYLAKQIVIATGAFQKPYTPSLSETLSRQVVQLHSSKYKNPSQIPNGKVLVVGAGNSGVQIACELAAQNKKVYLSISHPIQVTPELILGKSFHWWLDHLALMKLTSLIHKDSWFSPYVMKKQKSQIIGTKIKKLVEQNRVILKPRLIKINNDQVIFQDKSSLTLNSIIWCTGFQQDFSWIKISRIFDENKNIIQNRGLSPVKGLYFLGFHWLHTVDSSNIYGVKKDAEYIAKKIKL